MVLNSHHLVLSRSLCTAFIFLVLGLSVNLFAQDIESLGVKKGVKINGSVNLNTVGYYAKGLAQRRDPFNWFLTGSLNVNLFGYNAPFSFSYSNANKGFSQPFNQFSFSPQYKWVKTYIGYNSMTFSSYTLAGHVFFGGGVELTPGNWRIAAMYGRLRKAVSFDINDSSQYNNAAFKRMGYGLKVGYESNGNAITYTIFTAKDDVNSIPFVLPNSQLSPQQNIATSLSFRKTFLRRFFVEGEYAVSALNKNMLANIEDDSLNTKQTKNIIQGLLPENATSRYYDALKSSVGYAGNGYGIQLRYERIAPEYQTLGAYYFNSDMRNITLAPNVKLFNNKLTLAANVGVQQNNLDKSKTSTTKRTVGSFNVNYLPNEKWNVSGSYSNFSTFTNVRPQYDPFFQNKLDTLNYYQVSQTLNGTGIRTLGNQQKPQSIMVTLSYQKADNHATYKGGDNQQSDFLSSNLSYNYSIIPSNLTITTALNVFANNANGMSSKYFGPTLGLTKSMLEKTLRFSWVASYNHTSGGTTSTSPVLNNRVGLNYIPKEAAGKSKHSISLGVNMLNRLKRTDQQPAFTEVTGTLNYNYTF